MSPNVISFCAHWLPLVLYCLAIFIQSALPTASGLPAFPLSDKLAHFFVYAILGLTYVKSNVIRSDPD